MADHALTLKSLADAARLRDQVLTLLERADRGRPRRTCPPADLRRGGRRVRRDRGGRRDVRPHPRRAPLLSRHRPGRAALHPDPLPARASCPNSTERLGAYALGKLRARGIEFRLGVRATRRDPPGYELNDGSVIPTRPSSGRPATGPARCWGPARRSAAAAARSPTRMLRAFGLERRLGDRRLRPDPGRRRNAVPADRPARDARGQGRRRQHRGRPTGRPPPFRFTTIGVFVALGHRTAAGEIRGRPFSGLSAWLLWRGIYLAKLPGIEAASGSCSTGASTWSSPRDIVVRPGRPPAARVPVGEVR